LAQIQDRKKQARPPLGSLACQTFGCDRYFLGAAGAFVAGGEDMSPLSLQATKKDTLTNARNKYVMSFFMAPV